jgi:hypothetical protein
VDLNEEKLMSDLQTQLEEMVGDVDWSALGIHARSGRLVFVDPALDLIEVGAAMAEDDKVRFGRWLEERLVYQPDQPEIERRNLKPRQYRILIVQPFVLAQDLAIAEQQAD